MKVNSTGREYRRPPAADDHGAAGRGHLVRGADEKKGEAIKIDRAYVDERIGKMAADADLSRFVL